MGIGWETFVANVIQALTTSFSVTGGVVFGNLAFEIKDFNADGQYDFCYYSDAPMGFQILYSVSMQQ